MKKIFALALAAIMTAGMTTVAFADANITLERTSDSEVYLGVDLNDDGVITETADAKNELFVGVDALPANIEGGTEVAVFIFDGDTYVQDSDLLKSYKVYTDWTVGDLDAKPEIQHIKLETKDGSKLYAYAARFNLPENETTKAQDLIGDLSVYKTTSQRDDNKVTLGFTYGYDIDKTQSGSYEITKDTTVVDFDDNDTDVDITWGEDVAYFEVNVAGQGKLNLAYNVDFNKEVADLDKSANMDFLTFEGNPTFNKNGTLYIYAAEDTFLYEVKDGKLVAVDAEYDEDYEAWTFKTRTLGAYVISDKELEEQVITDGDEEASSSTTEDGGKENPDTGR